MYKYRSFSLIVFSLSLVLAGCISGSQSENPSYLDPAGTEHSPQKPETTQEISLSHTVTTLGLTYQGSDGNRVVNGSGNVSGSGTVQIEAGGIILWLVGVPFQDGVLWTVALEDGTIESYLVADNEVENYDLGRGPLPAGMPPMILDVEGEIYLNTPPNDEASTFTNPVIPDPDTGRVVYISESGDLVLWEHGETISRLEANALPDARLIQDEKGRLLFLSGPNDQYDHGVLGDSLEATSISLVETIPELRLIRHIEIPPPGVIEGIAPIWVDMNSDGTREVLVTVSDYSSGARLVLFSEEGQILAEGPAAGQGYRWRHQLAAAPLGPAGEMLIIDVLRPHLDATLEFFSWEGDRLVLQAELPGFSSHGIGSRNLDMALVGDLNGDGLLEVVLPGLGQESMYGISYRNGRAEIMWEVPLGGRLTSNLAGVTQDDGTLVLGAGVGEILLLWQ